MSSTEYRRCHCLAFVAFPLPSRVANGQRHCEYHCLSLHVLVLVIVIVIAGKRLEHLPGKYSNANRR